MRITVWPATFAFLAVPSIAAAQGQASTPDPSTAPTGGVAAAPAAPRSVAESPPMPTPAAAQTNSAASDLTTLRILHDKKIISDAEYDSALKDLGESTGLRAADANTFVLGKWSTTMYGFIEEDNIWDSTRSFNDLAGGGLVLKPGSIGGDNGRFQMGVRNSRLGFRMRAPETNGIRTSAMLEMDFLGSPTAPPGISEGGFFTSPVFRIRHFNFKVETPVVDVLVGQYWSLFGWQSAYQPNTVQIQGVPGEVYSRTPQIRISKTIKTDPVTFEVAIAATRPVQRDAATPDGQGGLRLAFNDWQGMQTVGSTGTNLAPLSVALTGYVRRVAVDEFSATPTVVHNKTAAGIAIDGFIPILPATKDKKDNSLSLNGEFASGDGSADQYTGFNGGAGYPALPSATGASAFTPNIDGGIVTYGADGALHFIRWTSFLVGAQYYLPGLGGKAWVSANYSRIKTSNLTDWGAAPAKSLAHEDWWDVNVFGDIATAVRVGVELSQFKDTFADGSTAKNNRAQGSAFFLF